MPEPENSQSKLPVEAKGVVPLPPVGPKDVQELASLYGVEPPTFHFPFAERNLFQIGVSGGPGGGSDAGKTLILVGIYEALWYQSTF
jgi:hypothetical protein